MLNRSGGGPAAKRRWRLFAHDVLGRYGRIPGQRMDRRRRQVGVQSLGCARQPDNQIVRDSHDCPHSMRGVFRSPPFGVGIDPAGERHDAILDLAILDLDTDLIRYTRGSHPISSNTSRWIASSVRVADVLSTTPLGHTPLLLSDHIVCIVCMRSGSMCAVGPEPGALGQS